MIIGGMMQKDVVKSCVKTLSERFSIGGHDTDGEKISDRGWASNNTNKGSKNCNL